MFPSFKLEKYFEAVDSNKEKEPKQKLFIFTAFRLAIEKFTKMLNYYENIWSPILSG
jgi:ERCC4-related helicase